MNLYKITNNQLTNTESYVVASNFGCAEDVFYQTGTSYKINVIEFISRDVVVEPETEEGNG